MFLESALGLLALSLLFLVKKIADYKRNIAIVAPFPGFRQFISSPTVVPFLAKFLPPSILPIRPRWPFTLAKPAFARFNSTVISLASCDKATLLIGDGDIVQQLGHALRDKVPKPAETYGLINVFGVNLVSAMGDDWRRHRTVANPAFNDANLRCVNEVTADTTENMAAKWDALPVNQHGERVADVQDDMTALALAAICGAGFGRPYNPFTPTRTIPAGYTLSFQDTMTGVIENLLLRLLTPRWAFHLPIKRLRHAKLSYDEFFRYMVDFVNQRQQEIDAGRDLSGHSDLVSLLLQAQARGAAMDSEGKNENFDFGEGTATKAKAHLSMEEVLADSFIFLFAGHETTAHTLTFAAGLLALHPDKQNKVLEEVRTVLGDRRPSYDDHQRLIYTKAVFYEALRMFPPTTVIPKKTIEPIEIKGHTIPAETNVFFHVLGTHYNAEHWPEPEAFKPERFDPREGKPYDKNWFIPFSVGHRACIGRRFSEVEAVVALAMMIQNFELSVPQGVNKDTLLEQKQVITTVPVVPLRLVVKRRQ